MPLGTVTTMLVDDEHALPIAIRDNEPAIGTHSLQLLLHYEHSELPQSGIIIIISRESSMGLWRCLGATGCVLSKAFSERFDVGARR